jgi:hypothetical protein
MAVEVAVLGFRSDGRRWSEAEEAELEYEWYVWEAEGLVEEPLARAPVRPTRAEVDGWYAWCLPKWWWGGGSVATVVGVDMASSGRRKGAAAAAEQDDGGSDRRAVD